MREKWLEERKEDISLLITSEKHLPPQAIAGRRERIRLDCHGISDALADTK